MQFNDIFQAFHPNYHRMGSNSWVVYRWQHTVMLNVSFDNIFKKNWIEPEILEN